MKMDKVANSGNDEFYTPIYAIKPIVKFLRGGVKCGVLLTQKKVCL